MSCGCRCHVSSQVWAVRSKDRIQKAIQIDVQCEQSLLAIDFMLLNAQKDYKYLNKTCLCKMACTLQDIRSQQTCICGQETSRVGSSSSGSKSGFSLGGSVLNKFVVTWKKNVQKCFTWMVCAMKINMVRWMWLSCWPYWWSQDTQVPPAHLCWWTHTPRVRSEWLAWSLCSWGRWPSPRSRTIRSTAVVSAQTAPVALWKTHLKKKHAFIHHHINAELHWIIKWQQMRLRKCSLEAPFHLFFSFSKLCHYIITQYQ